MIVAIDGPAGSGKSTIARELAQRFGFEKLDTGAMYRAVALTALERGIDLDDEAAVDSLARSISIRFVSAQPATRITVDGHDVTAAIRTPAVDTAVSKVAAYPGVRESMLEPQRTAAEGRDIVAEGRDIGTVVFPRADVKIFLTADPAERARRRVLQRHENVQVPSDVLARELAETQASIERRDAIDAQRAVAPLKAAPDAIKIDSTASSIEEVVAQIARIIDGRR